MKVGAAFRNISHTSDTISPNIWTHLSRWCRRTSLGDTRRCRKWSGRGRGGTRLVFRNVALSGGSRLVLAEDPSRGAPWSLVPLTAPPPPHRSLLWCDHSLFKRRHVCLPLSNVLYPRRLSARRHSHSVLLNVTRRLASVRDLRLISARRRILRSASLRVSMATTDTGQSEQRAVL